MPNYASLQEVRSQYVILLHCVLQVLGKDVAYELLPYSMRRDLHAKLAQAYEESKGSQKVAPSRIAFHYNRSCATVEVAEWHRTVKVCLFPIAL